MAVSQAGGAVPSCPPSTTMRKPPVAAPAGNAMITCAGGESPPAPPENERLRGVTVTCGVVLAIVIWKVLLIDPGRAPWPAKSLTVTTVAKAPAVVGVPLSKPLFESMERPGGPLAIEKV